MVFSSFTFLIFFLPFTIVVYFLLGHRFRNMFLLIMSIIFYGWGSPQYTLVMLGVIIINYFCGRFIDKYDVAGRLKAKKRALLAGVAVNLLVLIIFKYTNFFVANLNYPLQWLEFDPVFMKNIVLPIGISFYIFQSISYIVDVYRKDAHVQKKFSNLALYIAMFPQLVAGPIVRYNTIEKQIGSERNIPIDTVAIGMKMFIIGLGKKVLIANSMGSIADNIFGIQIDYMTTPLAWLGAFAYSLQIYFDFSGYSDMAIGLGLVFGFTFPINFNYPYISTSITEFWRRWHISLSSWFKDYLYIPLGGNRVNVSRMYVNLAIVFLATGFWHGANWTFILWGGVHGAFLVLEKITGWHKIERFKLLRWAITMLICMFAWVIFRADTMEYAGKYMATMLGIYSSDVAILNIKYIMKNYDIMMMALAVFGATPIFKKYFIASMMDAENPNGGTAILRASQYVFLLGIVFICIVRLAGSSYNPFIYFRF